MRKIAFLDRDGTLIVEPPDTFQVNGLQQMEFLPFVISSLKKLAAKGYELVIVTNQDGLGTSANPRDNYEQINRKMSQVFKGEGVCFKALLECPHYKKDDCDCRKPKTALVDNWLNGEVYDKEGSFVVGDRDTDLELAKNLGIRGFKLSDENDWPKIVAAATARRAEVSRKTAETDIAVKIDLDGGGKAEISTGLGFFDHMLDQIARHSGFDLTVACRGDLKVDEHHTIEDVGLALGAAFKQALGDKKGIERYAHERLVAMDECRTEIAIDISGRAYAVLDIKLAREYVGDFPTEMLEHFFHSFATAGAVTLNIKSEGANTHHQIECCFKAFARILRDAAKITGEGVVSTKGVL